MIMPNQEKRQETRDKRISNTQGKYEALSKMVHLNKNISVIILNVN